MNFLKLVFSALVFFLVSQASIAQDYSYKSVKKQVGDGELEILYGDDMVYITVDQMDGFDKENNYQKLAIMARWNGKNFKKNKVVNIDGEKKRIRFVSTDTTIAKFRKSSDFRNQGYFIAKTVGTVTILAIFDNTDTISIPITVKALDIEGIFTEDAVRDFIGEPSRINVQRLPYNVTEEIDGIIYNTEDLVKGRVVTHWMYEEYPGLILVIGAIENRDNVVTAQPAWLKIANLLFENL